MFKASVFVENDNLFHLCVIERLVDLSIRRRNFG